MSLKEAGEEYKGRFGGRKGKCYNYIIMSKNLILKVTANIFKKNPIQFIVMWTKKLTQISVPVNTATTKRLELKSQKDWYGGAESKQSLGSFRISHHHLHHHCCLHFHSSWLLISCGSGTKSRR